MNSYDVVSNNDVEDDTDGVTSTTDTGNLKNGYESKTNKHKWLKIGLICCISFAVMLLVGIMISYFNGYLLFKQSENGNEDSLNSTDDHLLNGYVLINDSLIITQETNETIKGQFTVEYIKYDFISFSNETHDWISFVNTKTTAGFTIDHANNTKILFTFYEDLDTFELYEFKANSSKNKDNVMGMESYLSEQYCEHFVELSVKLGAGGYLGTKNSAISDIHKFARWIWETVGKDDNINNNDWPELDEEFEKVNTIVSASKTAGHWITNMSELLQYTSNEISLDESNGYGSGRSLLGNCGYPSYVCGNSCFGMCGPQCWCWSWVCNDCMCWLGCYYHDWHCSCNGFFTWCCLNVFWVRCDGSYFCY